MERHEDNTETSRVTDARWRGHRIHIAILVVGITAAAFGSERLVFAHASTRATADHGCPAARPLAPNALALAVDAALIEAPRRYKSIDTENVRATRAYVADAPGDRGNQVRRECGVRAWHRTVVVDLVFPKMRPSASLSQGTVFVAHIKNGYRVWEVAH